MSHRFFIVDVFAEQPYSGNPLAVVIGEDLSPETMLKIAAEINFSETTFVNPDPQNDGYKVRIFTPAREIDFAGHPILGTAWVIRHHVARKLADAVKLHLSIGEISIAFESSGNVWFEAPAMTMGKTCSYERMARALGISPTDIETKTPVQQISAGTSAVIVPLRSLDALNKGRLDLEAYSDLMKEGFPPLTYLFCTQTRDRENNLSARFFFEAHGVREDPATGNGAAFLGAYLLHHKFFQKEELYLRIEQGHMVQRPSIVLLSAKLKNNAPEVSVGGRVRLVVQGELS